MCRRVTGRPRGARTSARTARTRARSASVRSARAVRRSRLVPAGTDGGRKQPTRTPRSAHRRAAATATVRLAEHHRHHRRRRGRHPGRVGQRGRVPQHRRRALRLGAQHAAAPRAPHRRAAGASPVSKMNDRAVSTRCAVTAAGPSTAPPWPPSALDSVTVATTSSAPASPTCASSPRPPGPRTPEPVRLVDHEQRAARRGTRRAARAAGRASPSTLSTLSVTTSARSSVRAASAASTAARSSCGTTATRARDSRQASTSEAWFAASETTSAPGPDSAVTTPRLAAYPEENTSPLGEPAERRRARAPARRAARSCR